MAKRIGIFSDIHGDTANLELIVQSLLTEGISSAVFLGDAMGPAMNQFTLKLAQESVDKKYKLRQDSQLRKEAIDGNYADSEINRWKANYDLGTRVSNKVAKATYSDASHLLSRFSDLIMLGGNWDYTEEFEEAFGDRYLESGLREMSGINFLGLSGGGSKPNAIMPDRLMSDRTESNHQRSDEWQVFFTNGDAFKANAVISHIHPSDGEGIKKESITEHYKSIIKRFNKTKKHLGIENLGVYIYGHKHITKAIYDEELNSFTLCPGSGSRVHNEGVPSFMVAEFDDFNRLSKAFSYEIRSSLKGLANVVLSEEYEFDYENRKVNTKKIEKTVIAESDANRFRQYLSLDENAELLQKGISTEYKALDAKEKDFLLRRNIAVMFTDVEENSRLIEEVVRGAAFDDFKGKGKNTRGTIEKIYHRLAEKAMEKFGASIDHIEDRMKDFFRDVLLKTAFGIEIGDIHFLLSKKIPNEAPEASSWAGSLIESARKNLSRHYQNYIFQDLKPEDYQGMAEMYLPSGYERKSRLTEQDAFNLWLQTYHNGVLTDEDFADVSYAYTKNKDFEKNKKTKEELRDLFVQGSEYELHGTEHNEDEQAAGMGDIADCIKDGSQQVILLPDGKEYLKTDFGLVDFDRKSIGLNKEDYTPVSFADYISQENNPIRMPDKNSEKKERLYKKSFEPSGFKPDIRKQ